jgi:large exoprotein involved in heme utilization and adhesion
MSTSGTGASAAGSIQIMAERLSMDEAEISSDAFAEGRAGNIDVTAARVSLTGGARILSNTFDRGQGSTITLTATEAVRLSGTDPDGFPSIITAEAVAREEGGTTGDAGAIEVAAPQVTLTEGAVIASGTTTSGQGGTITLTATEVIRLDTQSILFSGAESSCVRGNISLQAPVIALTEGAAITAESTRVGNAGNIDLIVTDTFSSTDSAVTTAAAVADGGNITLQGAGLLRLRNSAITATVGGGPATVGGNITTSSALVLLDNSTINANAFEGRGGNVTLTARGVVIDVDSTVSAPSERGIDGAVAIQALTNVTEAIAPLPQTVAPTAVLMRDHCAVQLRDEQVSSFVVHTQGSVPATPGDFLPGVLFETAPSVGAPQEGASIPEDTAPRAGYASPHSPLSRQDRLPSGVFQLLKPHACVGGG